MKDYSMKHTYSKDWCQGFCTLCGTSHAEQDEEIHRLREQVKVMREACNAAMDYYPENGETYSCPMCDMGWSGYSSLGKDHHDDAGDGCPFLKIKSALSQVAAMEKEGEK